jgi:hypothetical protein
LRNFFTSAGNAIWPSGISTPLNNIELGVGQADIASWGELYTRNIYLVVGGCIMALGIHQALRCTICYGLFLQLEQISVRVVLLTCHCYR